MLRGALQFSAACIFQDEENHEDNTYCIIKGFSDVLGNIVVWKPVWVQVLSAYKNLEKIVAPPRKNVNDNYTFNRMIFTYLYIFAYSLGGC